MVKLIGGWLMTIGWSLAACISWEVWAINYAGLWFQTALLFSSFAVVCGLFVVQCIKDGREEIDPLIETMEDAKQ